MARPGVVLGIDSEEQPLRRVHARRSPGMPCRRSEPERNVVGRGKGGFDRAAKRFRRKVPAPDASVDRPRPVVAHYLDRA